MFFGKRSAPDHHPDYPAFPSTCALAPFLAVDAAEILRFAGLDLSFTPPQGELLVEALSRTPLFGLSLVRAYARQGQDTVLFQSQPGRGRHGKRHQPVSPAGGNPPGHGRGAGPRLDPGGLIGGRRPYRPQRQALPAAMGTANRPPRSPWTRPSSPTPRPRRAASPTRCSSTPERPGKRKSAHKRRHRTRCGPGAGLGRVDLTP